MMSARSLHNRQSSSKMVSSVSLITTYDKGTVPKNPVHGSQHIKTPFCLLTVLRTSTKPSMFMVINSLFSSNVNTLQVVPPRRHLESATPTASSHTVVAASDELAAAVTFAIKVATLATFSQLKQIKNTE